MYSRFCLQYSLLAGLVSIAHGMIMVERVDGSFGPWASLLSRAPDGTVPVLLRNNQDIAYLATVLMGTPQQQVPMAPSLSQDLVAVASTTSSDPSYYNPKLSSTSSSTNEIATISSLSSGTFTGHYVGELCKLQSQDATSNFSYNASLALTDSSVRDALYPLGANGILGYGVSPSVPKNASLVNSFLPADFKNAVCGIELNHKDDPVPDGILTMGKVDASAFTGEFTNMLVPADSPVSWSVPYDKLSYKTNGSDYEVPGLLASIDLIHRGIQVPTPVAEKIYSCILGSQRVSATEWTVPCNASFPVTLTFGGKPFPIPERDTIRKEKNGTCYGVITGGATKIGQVGAPFLRNYYTQFGVNKTDGGAKVFVGFATKKLRQK